MSSRAAHDDGVSSVVAAVLLFALFSTAFMVYSIESLPQWEADNEQNHHRLVEDRLQQAKSGLEAAAARGGTDAITTTVPLGASTVPVLQTNPSSASLATVTGTNGFAASASFTAPALHLVDGAPAGNPTVDVAGGTVTGIAKLQSLLLGLSTTAVSNPDTAFLTVSATDGTATVTATLTHYGKTAAPACNGVSELRLTVTSSLGTSGFPLLCDVGNSVNGYRLDLLADLYGFAAATGRLGTPLALTFTDGGTGGGVATGSYAMTWRDTTGLDQVAGSGASASYAVAQTGSRISYVPQYAAFVSETLSFEGGALVASQGTARQAVAAPPPFDLAVSGSTGHLEWTLVQLTATGGVVGSGSADVVLQHERTTDVVLTTTGATFTLTTPSGAAWTSFLGDSITAAGLGANAVATDTGTGATLVLSSGGAVSQWVVHLHLIQATGTVS